MNAVSFSRDPRIQVYPNMPLSLSLTQAHGARKFVSITYIEPFGSLNFVLFVEGGHAKMNGRSGKTVSPLLWKVTECHRDFLASMAVNSRETTWSECKVLLHDLETVHKHTSTVANGDST